jgi:hypothetical protein
MCHGKAQNVPQYGTKYATVRHKMCHSTAQKDLCATGRHKMCHNGTKKLLDLNESLKKNKNNKAIIRAGRAALAAKNKKSSYL